MRFGLALLLAKLAAFALRILSKFTRLKGSEFPGTLALKVCPDFLGKVSRPKTVIAVTGTNGKTTMTNMVTDLLRHNGKNVISNTYGSNLNTGIATCLISGVDLFNKEKAEIAVLEIDERSCIRIYPYLKPDYLLCSNLSRDSIMRNAHPYYIFDMLNEYIPEGTVMVLNADDLISSRLKKDNPRVYYGIDQQEGDATVDDNIVNDARLCPNCYSRLKFKYMKYNQIGKAVCPNCGFASEDAEYCGETLDYKNRTITVRHSQTVESYPMISDTIYNIYNEIGVIALLETLGLSYEEIKDGLDQMTVVESRYKTETIGNVKAVAIMTKGMIAPACSAVMDYVRKQPGEKEVILYLEDQHEAAHGSENITWLYDCDFEYLNQENISDIVIIGQRRYDFYLRMLLAHIPAEKMRLVATVEEAIKTLEMKKDSTVYILHDLYAIKDRDAILKGMKEREEGGAA